MKLTTDFREKLKKILKSQDGVLIKNDLWVIISPTSEVDFYRQIKKLINEKLIYKISRGFYVGSNFSAAALAMTIRPESYLSMEYILAKHNLIGTYSEEKIRPVVGQTVRKLVNDLIIIEYKKISADLIFGLEVIDGVRGATKEKAFLDTLYFYQKGTKFYFDIYSDIDLEKLDKHLILKYLRKYKNSKFIKFVKDYLNE